MLSLTVTYFLLTTTLIIIKSIQFYTKEIPERILMQIYLHSSKTRSASTEWIPQQGNTWVNSSEGELSPTPAFYFRPLRRAWPFKFFISNISYIFEIFFWIILLPTTEASLTIQIYHYSNSDFHIDFVSEPEPDQCYISYWIFILMLILPILMEESTIIDDKILILKGGVLNQLLIPKLMFTHWSFQIVFRYWYQFSLASLF